MGGSNIISASGVFGTRGVASASNRPGIQGLARAASWTDASGNFWVFGGSGSDESGSSVALNGLWKFHP
jgi:hypothetical protein